MSRQPAPPDGAPPLAETLEAHEALLTFLNAAPVGLVQTTPSGEVTLINGRAAMLLLPLAAPPQRRLDNLFEVLAGVAPQLAALAAGFAPAQGAVCEGLRLAVPGPGGEPAASHLSLTLMKLDARRLMAVCTDISRQVRDEQALRESDARLRFTLDAVQVGDWALDVDSGLMQRSRRFDRCLGHPTPAADPRLAAFVQQVHPEDRDALLLDLQRAITHRQPWRQQCRVLWPDGSLHWVSVHGQPQGGAPDGPATQLLGILVDITAQQLAQAAQQRAQALEAENHRVLESTRAKSLFLANMSHELRTPLNAIIGFADLMRHGTVAQGSAQQQRFLGHIASSGRHLLQLINDVLDLSKVESGKFEFQPEPLQLHQLLNDVAEILNGSAQRKRLTLEVQVDPALGELVLDPARLKQVLYNYLSNAIKFSPAGGQVWVRARPEGPEHLRIEVEDQGIGIAEADLPRLFVEFQQLDAGHDRQHEGTGLGLALTRRLVQAQGGQVGVRSTPGVGSVFHLVLNRHHGLDAARRAVPLGSEAPLPQVPAQHAAPPHAAGLVPAQGQVQRLLVIEHDPLDQARLMLGLAQRGFDVDAAGNAAQALAQARGTAYDAITLDLRLPDLPGLDLLAGIRRSGASQGSPVVGVTVPAGGPGGGAARFAIANVLGKPLRSDELLQAVAGLQGLGPNGRPRRVMVLDGDPLARDLMCSALGSLGLDSLALSDGPTALAELARWQPDALVLDLLLPGMDGFALLDALRRQPRWRALPVLVWTSMALSEPDYQRLAHSAHGILGQGGGALAAMLDDLQHWREVMTRGPG